MLVKDVPTRWNSTYLMVKRILDLENTIVVFLNADRECDVQFSANDWDLMKALVRLLEPFFKATELLSANKIPISSVPLTIIEIKLLLGGNARFVDSMRDTLLNKLNDRFFNQNPNLRGSPVTLNILDDSHYTVPTLLNPSFRKNIFLDGRLVTAKQHLTSAMMAISIAEDDEEIGEPAASSTQRGGCMII